MGGLLSYWRLIARQLAKHLAQIISLTTMETLLRKLDAKVVMEILMPLMAACVSLANVHLAVTICRIMVKIILACFLSSCLMHY